jgi:hypothetical protein
MDEPRTVNRNLEIKDLPLDTDRILNTLAVVRGMTKRDIVKEALNEYAFKHKDDIAGLIP